MILIPGGKFLMGANPEDRFAPDNETPAHLVTLSHFYMSKFQIRQQLWEKVMGTKLDNSWNKDMANPPAECISWEQAQQFIEKINSITGKKFSLPSEAQWEYVARGGENGIDYFIEAGRFRHNDKNSLGIHDLLINNLEWCEDEYYDYSEQSKYNPVNKSIHHKFKVLRGGGPDSGEKSYRVSYRTYDYFDSDYDLSGPVYAFRVVLNEEFGSRDSLSLDIINENKTVRQDDYLINYLNNTYTKQNEEIVSMSPSNRELAFAMIDEFGVKYSSDGKKLLKGNPNLKKYIVREGTETICCSAWFDDNYFYDDVCQLESIAFPDSVKYIGDRAFQGCINLNEVKLSPNISYIGDYAFESCKLNLLLPSKIKYIGANPFAGCLSLFSEEPLENYILKDDTIYSKDGCIIISCCCQQSVFEFPAKIKIAGVACFKNNINLRTIILSNLTSAICADSFYNCKHLKRVILGKHLQNIYGNPFVGNQGIEIYNASKYYILEEGLIINPSTKTLHSCCSISETVRIPDGVEVIGEYAFAENTFVKNIYAPFSLKSIGKGAFKWCEHINLFLHNNIENIDNYAFEQRPYGYHVITSCTLYNVSNSSYLKKYFEQSSFYNIKLKIK